MVSGQEYVKRRLAKFHPLAGHSLTELPIQPDKLAVDERSRMLERNAYPSRGDQLHLL